MPVHRSWPMLDTPHFRCLHPDTDQSVYRMQLKPWASFGSNTHSLRDTFGSQLRNNCLPSLPCFALSPTCFAHAYASRRLTLGTRAGLEPQRGGKAVTVLPLVISRLHDKMKHSPATPQEYDGGNPTLLHAVMRERSEERRVGKECRSRWSP